MTEEMIKPTPNQEKYQRSFVMKKNESVTRSNSMYDPGKGIEKTKRRGKAFRQIEEEKPVIHKRQEEATNCLHRFFLFFDSSWGKRFIGLFVL